MNDRQVNGEKAWEGTTGKGTDEMQRKELQASERRKGKRRNDRQRNGEKDWEGTTGRG